MKSEYRKALERARDSSISLSSRIAAVADLYTNQDGDIVMLRRLVMDTDKLVVELKCLIERDDFRMKSEK